MFQTQPVCVGRSAVLTGMIATFVLLMYSMRISSGFAASLMLNMEAVATVLIALAFFGDHASPSIWLAVLCIVAIGILVTSAGGEGSASVAGALLVLASYAAWGIETSVMATLFSRDSLLVRFVECLPIALILSRWWPLSARAARPQCAVSCWDPCPMEPAFCSVSCPCGP